MASFYNILEDAQTRAVVQEGLLERNIRDSLLSTFQYRKMVEPMLVQGRDGTDGIRTAAGLLTPNMAPIRPGTEPQVYSYEFEQWKYKLNTYGIQTYTDKPSSNMAISSLFDRDLKNIALNAGQSLNRLARDRMFNVAMSGWTVADAAGGGTQALSGTSGTIRVLRLNGFTQARAAGSVLLSPVSATNTLGITIERSGGTLDAEVTGYTPDNAGDEYGPGTLSITYANGSYTVAARGYVYADDRSSMVRVGGGNDVGDIGASDVLTLASIRSAIERLRTMNVPVAALGDYIMDVDPTGQTELFSDTEFQNLMRGTGLTDEEKGQDPYGDFMIGRVLNTRIYTNNESPAPSTVTGGLTASYDTRDPFGGELYSTGATSGQQIHRALIVGGGAMEEVYIDLRDVITTGGAPTSRVINGNVTVNNDGLSVVADRVQIVISEKDTAYRDQLRVAWRATLDYPARTDYLSGDAARYKRMVCIEHA